MITIIKKPEGIYPAYNDSYIQFSSDLEGIVKATIQLLPVERFPRPHIIFSNLNGQFFFNLKDAVASRFNENGFKDSNTVFPSEWGLNIENAYLKQSLTIVDSTEDEEDEVEVSVEVEFYKGVKQVGQQIFPNNYQILNNSKNGIDYNLTYFEGFPFSFSMQKLSENDSVKVLNLNSDITSFEQVSQEEDAFRMYIDKVAENWTSSNYMPLSNQLNRLEISVNEEFKANLNLKKIENKCGVYLKWFNNDGDFSYFLFDEFYEANLNVKSLGEVSTNPLRNVNEGLISEVASIGKYGGKDLKIKATLDRNEFETLESLFSSPSVQMYSSRTPYVEGEFIDVLIEGNLSGQTKKDSNKIQLSVILPDSITPKL